jgi:hypothetical protein
MQGFFLFFAFFAKELSAISGQPSACLGKMPARLASRELEFCRIS